MCINFVDVNQMTEAEKYAMKDTWQLIDIWAGATLGSVLDMKACYHNIPVDPESQELLGVVTQDGIFIYVRMPFGVAKAPEWLQYVMDEVLGRVPGQPARSFYDDVQIPGTCWRRNWVDVVSTLRELTGAGFMINLRKCQFLQPRCTLVGMEICGGTYWLAGKSLKRWMGTGLPTMLQELQQVLGRLLWAAPFIPDFKARIEPIEALLSPKSSG